MRPVIVGFVGFKFLYFHLLSGLSVVLLFIVFLICHWNVFVGFVLVVWKLLFMKFWIFCLYCIGSITMELPLSADVAMAFLFFSFVVICFMMLDSVWFGLVLFCCFNLLKFFANFPPKYSRSVCGRQLMAVSASNAGVVSQFFFVMEVILALFLVVPFHSL